MRQRNWSERTRAWMMGLAVVWMASAPTPAWGQWTGGPTGPIYYNGGNVGIGTTSPSTRLEVVGSGYATAYFRMGDAQGNFTHYVGGGFNDFNSYGAPLRFYSYSSDIAFRTAAFDAVMTIKQGGNVGIGTANPQYLLSVNGTIGAKDVMVTNSGWPDYVFRPGYRLRPLSEVAAYIQAHHRLPDIPSAAEVKKDGVSVGEMQAKLLAKIEELTLHMIQQDKENRALRERLARLETRAGR